MILEVDIGNTRLKWRLRYQCNTLAQGGGDHRYKGAYSDIFADLADHNSVQKICVASVVPERDGQFSVWCKKQWQLEPVYAQVVKFCAGVTNGYENVSQMGVDRWLAMVAAYNIEQAKPCLVIDSGSACTVDLLLVNGVHLGGYIAPGLELMRGALFRDTGRVKLDSIRYDEEPCAGKSTHMAVSSGLRVMELGLVMLALEELLAASGDKPSIVITGGNGAKLAKLLENKLTNKRLFADISGIIVEPELVLNGLSLALEPDSFL